MRDTTSTISIRQARRLLHLDDCKASLTKSEIQQAFIRAAKLHHPDRRHIHEAIPSAQRFQQALEAKEVLLSHYCSSRRNRGVNPRYGHSGFEQGFPTRKLRILTLRQNLMLRGFVLTAITFGTLYDEWNRRSRRDSSNNRDATSSWDVAPSVQTEERVQAYSASIQTTVGIVRAGTWLYLFRHQRIASSLILILFHATIMSVSTVDTESCWSKTHRYATVFVWLGLVFLWCSSYRRPLWM